MQPARDPGTENRDPIPGTGTPQSTPPTGAREQLLLEQKFAALNTLAAGIAHEFNNVIAGILGSAELAALDIHEGHPAHQSLRQIFDASARGREFLHKVRSFALRPPIQMGIITPQSVVEESVLILSGLIPDRVLMNLQIAPGCPAIIGDATQLQQVILDLCLHCWQHLPDRRGEITLRLETIPAPGQISRIINGASCLRLTVCDNSPALEKAALDRMFDPFHTRRASTKKIGIELFSAREVVRAHGGEILAGCEPGHGLVFHIYLPIAG